MKTVRASALFCCLLLAPAVAWAEDAKKPAAKAGTEVETIKDVPYYEGKDANAERHKLDLYLPKGKKGFPVLVYVHGGGWTKGDRASFAKQGHMLADQGVGAVSVGYRLSQKHPGQIEDVAKAFAWVKKNIGKYGGRPDQLFISGHSAGGHLAALLATNGKYLKAEGLSLSDVRGAIPISGVYVIRPGKAATVFPKDEEGARDASPQSNVKEGEPPFLVMVAANESPAFVKMAEEFTKALGGEKVEAACLKVDDRNHGTIMSMMVTPTDPAARALLQFIARHSSRK